MSVNQKRLAMRKRAALNAYQYGVQGPMPKRSLFKKAPARALKSNYSKNQGNHGNELKDLDTLLGPSGSALSFSTTGSVTLINGVSQGTDFTNRVGRKFQIRSVLIRGQVNLGATPTSSVVRWMLVYDKQANGVAPAIGDIVFQPYPGACNNLTNRDRFVVLADKTFEVDTQGPSKRAIKKYMKCNLETVNGGTGATVASIQTGALYFVTMGDLATGVTAPVLGETTCRIRFSDD